MKKIILTKPPPAAGGSAMEKDYLILKRASASRPSGEWSDDDYDVLADSVVVDRIFKANAAPVGEPWVWTLAFGHHEDRTPTHGYAATEHWDFQFSANRASGCCRSLLL
jgi:hypothetical protein